MEELLRDVFCEVLTEERIEDIIKDYDKNKDVPLAALGIDSLYMMGIVLKINELVDNKISFDDFKFEDIETLSKIIFFIENNK